MGKKTEERAQKDHEMIQSEFKAVKQILAELHALFGAESELKECFNAEQKDRAALMLFMARIDAHLKKAGEKEITAK